MLRYSKYGKTKKEFMLDRMNRARALKIQFPFNERISATDQRHRFYIDNKTLIERG